MLDIDYINQAAEVQEDYGKVTSNQVVILVDFSKPSNEKRLVIVDTKDRKILFKLRVSHGKGSVVHDAAFAEHFSNVPGTNASSIGMFKILNHYNGKNGDSVRIKGMSATNTRAYKRNIVIHAADYMSDKFVKDNARGGLSHGCFALSHEDIKILYAYTKPGVLLYAFKN